MKRTPLVLASTVAGLSGVAVFHSTPQKIVLGTLTTTPAAATAASSTGSSPATPATTPPTAPATTANPATSTGPATAPSVAPTTTSSVAAGVRSATGPVVNYYYGQLSIKVTASGTKIAKITVATLSDGGNPYSAYVDHIALPMLQKQALAAQSANIQGVSGASYTSAGFSQSLQGALSQLKLK